MRSKRVRLCRDLSSDIPGCQKVFRNTAENRGIGKPDVIRPGDQSANGANPHTSFLRRPPPERCRKVPPACRPAQNR